MKLFSLKQVVVLLLQVINKVLKLFWLNNHLTNWIGIRDDFFRRLELLNQVEFLMDFFSFVNVVFKVIDG